MAWYISPLPLTVFCPFHRRFCATWIPLQLTIPSRSMIFVILANPFGWGGTSNLVMEHLPLAIHHSLADTSRNHAPCQLRSTCTSVVVTSTGRHAEWIHQKLNYAPYYLWIFAGHWFGQILLVEGVLQLWWWSICRWRFIILWQIHQEIMLHVSWDLLAHKSSSPPQDAMLSESIRNRIMPHIILEFC